MLAKAIFAAGCFWGIQSIFDGVSGVVATRVGYIGGSTANPSYEQVCSGKTGHAEAIEIIYNPKLVNYNQLLDVFFSAHDPTSLNQQGFDIGEQYRSAIFYLNEEQRLVALQKISQMEQIGVYKKPIVTKIEQASNFYPAEEYHQHYLQKNMR